MIDDNDPLGKALGLPALENEKQIENLIAKAHDNSAKIGRAHV